MKSLDIARRQQRLDRLFDQAGKLPPDYELQSHWARYLCVLVSGYLETSIRHLYGEYAAKRSSIQVAGFVSDQLEFFQNPNMQKIMELAGSFSRDWRRELEELEDEVRLAVDSIVNNRNQISHGEDVGISHGTLKRYYESANQLLNLIEGQCDPQ